LEVALTVTNTGSRTGRETVQVYVADPESSVFRPEQELKGFAPVSLEPGASERVTLTLDARAFSFWHVPLHRWVVEGGSFEIRVGASSRDLRLTATVQLAGDEITPPLSPRSPASAWLDHPVAGPRLRDQLGSGNVAAGLFDESTAEMIRAIPMDRLTRFPGFPITEDDLTDMAAAANQAIAP